MPAILSSHPRRHGNGWTPERRARQAEAIRRWRPWARSTGPRTAAGKAAIRDNARKHSIALQEVVDILKQQKRFLQAVNLALKILEAREKMKKRANELMEGKKSVRNQALGAQRGVPGASPKPHDKSPGLARSKPGARDGASLL